MKRNPRGYRIGSGHHNAKLSEDAIRVIRARQAARDAGYETLAREYGVAPSTVRDICQFRTWPHVR